MLQQILQDMYIDPDLLAELDEEQKQILFCKMREEQVRKYNEREKKIEKEEKKKSSSAKRGGRRVGFLLGSDGKEWVWIMGEHKNDKSLEQILEEEAQEKARLLAESEAEELRKKQEEEMHRKLKEEEQKLAEEEKKRINNNKKKSEEAAAAAEEAKKQQENERKQRYQALRKRHDYQRRKSVEEINKMKERRSSEIYMSFREARQLIEQQANDISQKIQHDWEEQEKKAKMAEKEKRAIARRAREEHRRSVSSKGQFVASFNKHKEKEAQSSTTPRDSCRGARPTGRESIVAWYKEVEKLKGSGLDLRTGQVATWFHGIITRQDAEDLLEGTEVGTFLVRVSERIWGYAISYKGHDRYKHFLIDTSDGSYQFFGTNQITHDKLADLVSFHKSRPISGAGQELLIYPCPQKTDPPDYGELFSVQDVESSYL